MCSVWWFNRIATVNLSWNLPSLTIEIKIVTPDWTLIPTEQNAIQLDHLIKWLTKTLSIVIHRYNDIVVSLHVFILLKKFHLI